MTHYRTTLFEPVTRPAVPDLWEHVSTVLAWLDAVHPRTDHEICMRVMKVGEEHGEAVAAYIGMTGQNPRKGITHTRADLAGELCDVAVTALVALATVTGTPDAARNLLSGYLADRRARLNTLLIGDGS